MTSGRDFGPLIVQLRDALHQHIERLRERFGNYPFVVEWWTANDNLESQDAPKETSAPEAATLGYRAS